MPPIGVWRSPPTRQVHATFSGRCYHRAGCLRLGRKTVAITHAAALAKGLTPCKLCMPPPYGGLHHDRPTRPTPGVTA